MRLPYPSDVGTTLGFLAWARKLISAITSAWSVEHREDGAHRFPWVSVPFDPNRFRASGSMTWTPDVSDQRCLQYRRIDDTVEIHWRIVGADIGGTASNELRLALPAGMVAAADVIAPHWYSDAGTEGVGFAGVLAGESVVRLYKLGSGSWTLTTSDNTSTAGCLSVRVA